MKTLVSGPLFASDDGLTPADEIFPSTDPNTADDGVIGVTLLHSQHYVVEIVLENTGGNGDSDGIVLTDVFGADIDLDPIAQDDYEDGGLPLDGLCEGALAINCDIDGGGNNGVILTGDCSYVLSQPDSASNSNPTAKQPEFITFASMISTKTKLVRFWCSYRRSRTRAPETNSSSRRVAVNSPSLLAMVRLAIRFTTHSR